MQLYSGNGDSGFTQLGRYDRVAKSSDEIRLIAHIDWVKSHNLQLLQYMLASMTWLKYGLSFIFDEKYNEHELIIAVLKNIDQSLYECMGLFYTGGEFNKVAELEDFLADIADAVPTVNVFISAGTKLQVLADMARTSTRLAETCAHTTSMTSVASYLNRLSSVYYAIMLLHHEN